MAGVFSLSLLVLHDGVADALQQTCDLVNATASACNRAEALVFDDVQIDVGVGYPTLPGVGAEKVDTTNTAYPSEGEAAAALEILAREPRFAGPVEAARNGPRTRAMGFGVGEGFLIAGLIVALQTAIDFERDKDGRWSIKIKKKAASDAMLKPLVKKLLALLGSGGSAD